MSMSFSNFQLKEIIGNNVLTWKFRANVDVTTKKIFTKKTERLEVFKFYSGHWYFTETGEFAKVENLSRAFEAKNGKNLQDIEI